MSGRDLAASAWSGCAQVREPPEATQVRPQTLTSSRVRVPAVRDGVIPCVPTGVAFQISRLQLARGGGQSAARLLAGRMRRMRGRRHRRAFAYSDSFGCLMVERRPRSCVGQLLQEVQFQKTAVAAACSVQRARGGEGRVRCWDRIEVTVRSCINGSEIAVNAADAGCARGEGAGPNGPEGAGWRAGCRVVV